MNTAASTAWSVLGRVGHNIAAVVAECNEATRRMTQLATAPDRYLLHPDTAPDTYAEFLYRTSSVLTRDPYPRCRP